MLPLRSAFILRVEVLQRCIFLLLLLLLMLLHHFFVIIITFLLASGFACAKEYS